MKMLKYRAVSSDVKVSFRLKATNTSSGLLFKIDNGNTTNPPAHKFKVATSIHSHFSYNPLEGIFLMYVQTTFSVLLGNA